MICHIPASGPVGAARVNNTGDRSMDITLHIGAHRSATTSFQHYMRDHHATFNTDNVGFWGPKRMRGGMLDGLFPGQARPGRRNLMRRAEGRVQLNLARCRNMGLAHLLISDENLIGTLRNCMRTKTLYPGIGERMSRVSSAFDGQIGRIVLSIRAQDLWWASGAAYTIARGHPVPTPLELEMISQNLRCWRDVITDLACAVPSAKIVVTPFEQFAGQPDVLYQLATGRDAPADTSRHWCNRRPDLPALRKILTEQGAAANQLPDGDDRWQPFTSEQSARLRENYADDLHWLHAGADGLATLATDPTRTQTGINLHAGAMTEGRTHDSRQEKLARSG